MLLRELRLKLRDGEESHWHWTVIQLADGKSLYIEKYIHEHRDAPWGLIYNKLPTSGEGYDAHICDRPDDRISYTFLDEFEAQAVLDHYLQESPDATD